MSRQVQDAYIVAALRSPVGKARGVFRTTRPDELLAHVIKGALAQVPQLDPHEIQDAIIGCAMPEAEQGMNIARLSVLLAGLPNTVAAVTVNRFCASGLQTVAQAADRIRLGEADVMLAGGTENMSMIPMGGNKVSLSTHLFDNQATVGAAYGMGVTAEKVAERWNISREDQDAFALQSHQRAIAAIQNGDFRDEIIPYTVETHLPGGEDGVVKVVTREVKDDEGPRADSSMEGLAKLRPVFSTNGSVTAGNSSQMSDGAGAVIVMSEAMVNKLGIKPKARFVSYAVAGVPPEIMGIGPKEAIPKALAMAGLKKEDIDWFELNEAFASQSLAVIRELGLDPAKVNPQGGAIALGHPLGATGAIRVATLVSALQRKQLKYGMVTMCVGGGMGAAGIFERV